MILETAYSPDPKTIPPSSLAQIRNYTDNKFQMRFTPAILEEIMVNATVTIISGRRWNTTADVTVETWNNYYRFSNRAHIFIPYSVVLMLALVFVTMGASALVTNGVPAESSSFLQVLCTTTGSRALENAAAGGCLGGTSSVNPDLANMLLLYGELTNVRTQRGWVKRAGFGPVDEVRELQKGQLYGVVDDDCLLSHNARAYLANKRTRESQYMHDIKGINVPIL